MAVKKKTKESDQIRARLEELEQDFSPLAFARLLTAIDREGPNVLREPALLQPKQFALRIGITGPPGAGKSSLVAKLLTELKTRQLKIGVVAVDPSSPRSQGAILGDRIRYSEHFTDPSVFIRSLGTRGSLGGLSGSAYLMLRAFDACAFDLVLIETVGVGQAELEIMHVADHIAVVLVPESGDSIQAMKAGILEIADLLVVNKSDRPGADALVRELEANLDLDAPDLRVRPKVVKASALTGDGIEVVAEEITKRLNDPDWRKQRLDPKRLKSEARAILRAQWEAELDQACDSVTSLKTLQEKLTKQS